MKFKNLEETIEVCIPNREFYLLDVMSGYLFKRKCDLKYIDYCLDKFNDYYTSNGELSISRYKSIEDTIHYMVKISEDKKDHLTE